MAWVPLLVGKQRSQKRRFAHAPVFYRPRLLKMWSLNKSNVSIPWVSVRKADSEAPDLPHQNLHLNTVPKWRLSTSESEKAAVEDTNGNEFQLHFPMFCNWFKRPVMVSRSLLHLYFFAVKKKKKKKNSMTELKNSIQGPCCSLSLKKRQEKEKQQQKFMG